MNHPGVQQKVHSRQRIPHEEIVRQHVPLQAIAGGAGRDQVAVRGDAAPRTRVHMIDRRMIVLEPCAAVHAAPAAVAHHGALERSLEIDVAKVGRTTPPEKSARRAGKADAMNAVPRHCTSPKRTTPRAGWGTRAGRRVVVGGAHQRVATTVGRRCRGSVEGRRSTLMCLQSLIGGGAYWAAGARTPYECRAERRGASAWRVRLSYFRRRHPRKGHGTAAAWRGVGRARVGSRNAPMIRAAIMSSTVRSGISEFANGSGTLNPSPWRRGIRWMWKWYTS